MELQKPLTVAANKPRADQLVPQGCNINRFMIRLGACVIALLVFGLHFRSIVKAVGLNSVLSSASLRTHEELHCDTFLVGSRVETIPLQNAAPMTSVDSDKSQAGQNASTLHPYTPECSFVGVSAEHMSVFRPTESGYYSFWVGRTGDAIIFSSIRRGEALRADIEVRRCGSSEATICNPNYCQGTKRVDSDLMCSVVFLDKSERYILIASPSNSNDLKNQQRFSPNSFLAIDRLTFAEDENKRLLHLQAVRQGTNVDILTPIRTIFISRLLNSGDTGRTVLVSMVIFLIVLSLCMIFIVVQTAPSIQEVLPKRQETQEEAEIRRRTVRARMLRIPKSCSLRYIVIVPLVVVYFAIMVLLAQNWNATFPWA